MDQYISKSALVVEIERRCEVIANASNDNNRELAAIYGAQQCELINLVQFINTLEVKEEPVSDDLEKAINAYIGHTLDIDEGLLVSCKRKAFKAGAEWQKQQFEKNHIEQKENKL